jgi:predicted Zn-dependent protease
MRGIAAPAALIVIAFATACGGPQIQSRSVGGADMAKVLPAAFEAEKPREGDPRTVKVRVWTDPGVRALPRWKDDISEQVDYANQLLTPLLGARVQIEDWKEWPRTGEPHQALTQLAEADKGDGVIWVIGFIAAPDTASKAMTELGYADPLGKYVVVRAWNESAEAEALSGSLPDLKETERNEVHAAHKRHKEASILLRALAVTLGGIAETEPTQLLNPSYSRNQVGFSERNRELMTMALDGRLAEETEQVIAKKLLESIEKAQWGGWVASSVDEVTKRLRNVLDQAKAGKTAVDVPPAAYDQYSRIKTLALQGKTADALVELENLLTAYPGNGAMHMLRCEILLKAAKDPKASDAARTACKRVSELAPGDPSPHLAIAETQLRAKDIKGARAELLVAEGKVANLSTGTDQVWRKIIGMYQSIGSLTWTEDAIAKAKLDNDPIALQVAQQRSRYGVPRGSKIVAPEDEAALVTASKTAIAQVNAAKFGDAEKTIATAERKWAGASGLLGARCNLNYALGQFDAARAACTKAITANPTASWALYMSGVIALRGAGGTKSGIEHLKTAIEVDPELGAAWRTLAKAYKQRGENKTALDQLARDYQARFGQPLPQ